MENKNILGDMFMMGVEGDTYKRLLDIAKKRGKTVVEVASEALQDAIEKESTMTESKERKVLMG